MRSTIVAKEATDVSEIPCRLNADAHEQSNEVFSVPQSDSMNILFWCTDQRLLVGSEDPMKLHSSLSFWFSCGYIE